MSIDQYCWIYSIYQELFTGTVAYVHVCQQIGAHLQSQLALP